MNRLLKKYKEIPQTVKASYWFIICNVFQKGIAFITIPIYTRLLTTTEYGTYSVYITWFGIISIFASLSLSAGFFNVGVLKYESEKNRFLSSVQGLSTVSTIIVCALCFLFFEWFNKLTELNIVMLFIMSIQLLFSTPLLYWSALERFNYKYKNVVVVTMLSSVLTVIASLILINLMPDKTYSLVIGAASVQITVGIFFFVLNLKKGKCFFDKKIWKYGASFGIPLIPHYLAYSILSSSDRVMINNMCSTSDAGIYSLACNISVAVNIVTNAIDATMNPYVYTKLKTKEYNEVAKTTNYIIIAFGVAVVGCALVAPEILTIIAPQEYQSAKWVMPPVMAGCFFLYLAGCFMRVEFYHEKKHLITIASISAAIANITLNIIFIPLFGFVAAAYTTLISYIAFAGVHYIGMSKICKENKYVRKPFDGRSLLIISLVTMAITLALLLFYEKPVLRYGFMIIIIAVVILKRNVVLEVYKNIKNGKK